MIVKIQRTSTLEANVSQRTIEFEVYVDGKLVEVFDEFEDAEAFKLAILNSSTDN